MKLVDDIDCSAGSGDEETTADTQEQPEELTPPPADMERRTVRCRPRVAKRQRQVTPSASATAVTEREILDAIRNTDVDGLDGFGQSVAGTLRRFNVRQQALAKLRIQQVLYTTWSSV